MALFLLLVFFFSRPKKNYWQIYLPSNLNTKTNRFRPMKTLILRVWAAILAKINIILLHCSSMKSKNIQNRKSAPTLFPITIV